MVIIVLFVGAAAAGCKTQMLYLKDFNLPFCDGLRDQSKIQPEPNDQVRFRECLKAASGIIIGSPDYHGVPSGVLINAIDLTTFDEWSGKMVGLVSVSGGQGGGIYFLYLIILIFFSTCIIDLLTFIRRSCDEFSSYYDESASCLGYSI